MTSGLEMVLVLLLAAVLAVVVFRRMGLPPLVAYLSLGISVGPHALGLLQDSADTRSLAEFGVVFLMFSVGIEFSLPQLVAMRRTVFGLGLAQVALTLSITAAVAMLLGVGWRGGIALGAVFAMSSTAIVSKMLAERLELGSAHGRQIMGVALFQDLAVVPLLILIPALGNASERIGPVLWVAAAKAAVALILLLGLGKVVIRRWFLLVARDKSSELFVLNVLLVTLGLAYVTHLAGLSLALGAFLGGMLISETEFRYQVEDDIKPFRDVLLGLFFVTVGMMLDVRVVMDGLPQVLLLLLFLFSLKLALVVILVRAFRHNPSVAVRTALALAPAGEFGFVLLSQAGGAGLLAPHMIQQVLGATLLSMLAAPFLIAHSDRIVLYFVKSEWMNRALALHELSVRSLAKQRHVVVCGYGRSGQNLARFLEREEIDCIALDVDPERVRAAAAAGESVVYGDAGRREVLVAAGIARASAVVITFADVRSALRILHHVHELEPAIPVIVRTFDDVDLDRLRAAGAAEVVPEILEGSLMLASHAMLLLGVPLTRVLKRIREVRRERYQLMRGFFHGASDDPDGTDEGQPRLQSVILSEGAYATGKTLAELGLARYNVVVTAIRRRQIRAVSPAAETRLELADVVVLLGNPEQLSRAEGRLLQG